MSILEVSHLTKTYDGKAVVDDLTFSIEPGEVFGLLGPNGAGKSTTMMMIAGQRRPDGGSIQLNGHPVDDLTAGHRLDLGLVPQEVAIYPDLTGRENLEFFGQIYGMRGARLRDRVDHVLSDIGLTEHAHQAVSTYSGGMKRRLNFGAGLLHEPRLVILDEPTVGVDPQSRSHLLESVQRQADQGRAVIYASHYMEEAESICDRVAIIDAGRLLKIGVPTELLEDSHSNVWIEVLAPADRIAAGLRGAADVQSVNDHGAQVIVRRERCDHPAEFTRRVSAVLEQLAAADAEVLSIETRDHNLEQLFLDLTGRNLRD
jgi:ABC-2 type transport system ATP-binding protein